MLGLTVVVSAGGPLGNLQACLEGLADQLEDEGGFEIILVTGAGEPRLDLAQRSSPADVRLIHIKDQDLGEAWNRGAEAARGEVLLFMRDDFRATRRLIAAHRAMHRERSDVIALGRVRPASELGTALLEHWREPAGGVGPQGTPVALLECAGQTLSLRRETLEAVGPYATGLAWGTEVEMAFRVVQRGGVLLDLGEEVGQGHRAVQDREILTTARQAGTSSVELYRRVPSLLPHLGLGSFQGRNRAGLRLRRLLLAIGGPSLPIGLCRRVLSSRMSPPQWNEFLISYYYWRGVRQAVNHRTIWRSLTRAPVILMYHAIAAPGERAGRYLVPLRQFRRQMAWLKSARYQVLALDELLDCRRGHRLPPGRSVILTFDDGYADNRQLALPVLQKHGFSAIFFLVTASIGGRNNWDQNGELAGRPLLSWGQITELLSAGMQVGGHTRTHVVLPDLPLDRAEQEIAGSRSDLEARLDRPVRAFAYPYGRLDATTPAAVAKAGFEGACCSRSGPNEAVVSSYLLRRIEVRGTASLRQFIRAIRSGHVARLREGR